jgi:PAS domain S-box-containing protein
LKADKERFDLVAKATQDAIWDWNLLTQEIWWNEGFKELFGYREEEIEPTIDSWTSRVHPDDKERVVEGIHKVIDNGGKNWSCEYRFRKADGSYALVFDRGYALHNEDGKPYRMLGSMQDITERKQAAELLEQKIEERTRELRQVNDQLKQFTYAASHDLQEPLRKVSFFLERLLSNIGSSLSEENKRISERIEHTTRRMRGLIDDLLAYSNTTLGVTGFEKVDLTDVVKEVIDDMEATIIQKGATVDLQQLPRIKGDQRQLRQLFQNLISNALKYQKGDVAPQVHIRSQLVKGEAIEACIPDERKSAIFHQIMVKDNGIGFHPDDAEKIFSLFQRLHGKAEYEGTGVGLAIVQKVVENHHGFIWAESKPGEGATFNVLLPAE